LSGKTSLFLILPLLILVIGFTSSVDGQVVNPITVSTDKASYSEGQTIIVTGEVSEILFGYAISLTVIAPNGDVVLIDQLKVDRYKKFQTEIAAGGSLYNEAGYGTYTIEVLYATPNRTASTSFQYIGSGTTQPKLYEIPIVGNVDCKIKTNKALELLKNKAKKHFEIVTDNIRIIECVEKGSGIRVWDSRVQIGEHTMNAGTIWLAGALVHESCHSLLYSDYLKNNPQSNFVPTDVYSGRNAETFCLGFQYSAISMIDHGRYTADYFINLLKSKWWEIPYEDRWW